MNLFKNSKRIILFLGDILCFYLGLFLMFLIRFKTFEIEYSNWILHLKLFSLVFFFWIIVFYIADIYEINNIFVKKKNILLILILQIINLFLAISFFYIFSIITPKTNLILVFAFSTCLLIIWHWIFFFIISRFQPKKILIIGKEEEILEIEDKLKSSSKFGYNIIKIIDDFKNIRKEQLEEIIEKEKIHILSFNYLLKNNEFYKKIFNLYFSKIEIIDLSILYEFVFKKVPINILNEKWFLENIKGLDDKIYDSIKRSIDFILALVGLIITLPFWFLIALGVKISSKGPVFYRNLRIGEERKQFNIIKFRTMEENSNRGPQWVEKKDKRITKFGNFLRKTHIDEIPQFISVLKGELSFVGPRPERVDLEKVYSKEIPFYNLRHLIKPGLVGWAQFNHPHNVFSSLEETTKDTIEKLKYDIHYLKNRSLWLDISIIIKAIRIFLFQKTN
jgi:exopolysaccharide biosynthesis polyprenyl glycosylphosphotransferase